MRTQLSFAALAAAGLFATGCSTPQARTLNSGPAEAAQPVKAHVVSAAPAPSAVRYSASIEAREQVALAFKSSGYIDIVMRRAGADGKIRLAQPGDAVTRGAVLARVSDADYRERVNQGRARLNESEAGALKARLDLARARTLYEQESLTRPELDAAQSSFDAAEARVASARADLAMAQTALADCALAAPSSGVILERRIELGSLASAGTVGFVIGDLTAVKARFGIPDAQVGSIALGQSIDVTVEGAAGAAFAGRVTSIAPAADQQSRVFAVEVTIPNGDGRLRPGMIGTVSVTAPALAASDQRVAVPLTAIVRSAEDPSAYGVMVIEQKDGVHVARARRVALGNVVGNAVTVRDGIAVGDRIVVAGASLVADGQTVRVISE